MRVGVHAEMVFGSRPNQYTPERHQARLSQSLSLSVSVYLMMIGFTLNDVHIQMQVEYITAAASHAY